MKLPAPLAALVTAGVVDAALRPLSRGMAPRVHLVRSEGALCVVKLEAAPGAAALEAAVLTRLGKAGVRVPEVRGVGGGALRMELVRTLEGAPAPRLSDVTLPPEEAKAVFEAVVREVARMLVAGLIHRELTPREVLLSAHGPVLIDLAGAVEAGTDPTARSRLVRGVNAVRDRLALASPSLRETCFGEELWALRDSGALTSDCRLTGRWRPDHPGLSARSGRRSPEPKGPSRPWDTPEPPGRHPRPWVKAAVPARETPVKPTPSRVEAARETPVKAPPSRVEAARETPVKPPPARVERTGEAPTSPAAPWARRPRSSRDPAT